MPPAPADELLAIAHVARPHGVRGEVSALAVGPPMADLDALLAGRPLIVRAANGKLSPATGEWARPHNERWLIKLAGVDDMNAADLLRGADLCLRRADLPDLPENWYYEADLQGCRVVDARLGDVGVVAALELGYVQPQLKIRRPDGREVLIPWRTALFPHVDLPARTIQATLPPGLPGLEDDATETA